MLRGCKREYLSILEHAWSWSVFGWGEVECSGDVSGVGLLGSCMFYFRSLSPNYSSFRPCGPGFIQCWTRTLDIQF